MQQTSLFAKCASIIDSEYDVLANFTKNDLRDYIFSLFPEADDAIVDELWNNYFS